MIQPPIRLSGERHIAIGDGVFIGSGSWLQVIEGAPDGHVAIDIGSGTTIAGGCVVSAVHSIRLGRKVLFARNVYVADHMHAFEDPPLAVMDQGLTRVRAVEIGDGAWLGQNVVIGPGVRVGRGSVVGANAVVINDIPDYCIAVGAPARVIRSINDSGT